MNDQVPRICIGLPVYNAQKYLRHAIDSILAQTFEDFEIIISDNASTDNTESICREYAASDSRIRYGREEQNRGAIWNFNRVFQLARGKYFKWAASDDVCDPSFLERCVHVLDSDDSIVWCHPLTNHIDERGKVIPGNEDPTIPGKEPAHSLMLTAYGLPRNTRASLSPHERFEGVLLGTTWCSDSYGLIRSDALRRTRMLLPYYGAEKVLMGELSLQGQFAEIPEVLFYQRLHQDASGGLATAEQQRKFADAAGAKKFSSTRLQLVWGHLGAVLHARLLPVDRIRCLIVLGRYLMQFRKWTKILFQTATGAGIGADRRTVREQGKHKSRNTEST